MPLWHFESDRFIDDREIISSPTQSERFSLISEADSCSNTDKAAWTDKVEIRSNVHVWTKINALLTSQ